MSEPTDPIRHHYDPDDGGEALLARIEAIVSGLEGPMTSARLAGLDQFHTRGLAATLELAELAGVREGLEILDAGSGLGGPSRHLARASGSRITGVDLSPRFVAIATRLARACGLDGLVTYKTGDLLSLPFPEAAFDLVWTQHVVMNIRDRARLYREFRRVSRPRGKLAFHDVIAADGQPTPHYPVPWARSDAASFLMTKAETVATLDAAGFMPVAWKDVTDETLAWFGAQRPPASDGLSLATVMGPGFAEMTANLARNLREGRLRVAMGLFAASAQP